MRCGRQLCVLVLLVAICPDLHADELKLLPSDTTLASPRAFQRLRVFATEAGRIKADRTDAATFTSSDTKVALVDEAGIVTPVSDGQATITASVGKQLASATIKVAGVKQHSPPSFRNEVLPILTKIGCNSGACHGALAGKGGLKLSLRGYDPEADHFVITRQANGRRVDHLDPAQSLFLLKPLGKLPHGGGERLDEGSPDHQVLLQWLAVGAPANQAGDPGIVKLEVFPAEALLKPEAALNVLVRAWYSDGRMADVTTRAKFSSNADLVAGVDESGKVTVRGHGEAAINVWYDNLVATCRVTSPHDHKLDSSLFALSQKRGGLSGVIDELVMKKLAALRIPPSPPCTDFEFIRRAYLDAAGILPSPEEVTSFVRDQAPDKRARLIDKLLERPEFVDYWTYKWCDLLLVSTRKLPQQAVWSFYQFIRQGVADNKPWDRFAREILTASGSNLQNGAANYFVLHKDASELAEATSVTFMGMSIACARCHNHPLEKWSQDQYWSYANLFSRVALKNGERGGEIFVQSQPFGEAFHLRRGVAMMPTPLDGKALALESPRDRRQYFAEWLTKPENPYFAKAVVNRIWRNFLGRGLVEAEDDLRQTNPPSNAELFDAIAEDFVAHRYDTKYLVREIMNSATYQRSSNPLPENATDDRYYSHYLVRRLSAEVVLDAYSQVTGVPTPFTQVNVGTTGGTSATSNYPLGTRALQLPDSQVVSRFLEAFGRPDREQTCSCEREQDSSVGQALHLNNGQTLNNKLRAKDSRISQWLAEGLSDDEVIRRLFMFALSREPNASEIARLRKVLAESSNESKDSRREGFEDLFWAVLTGREFLFNR